MDSLMEALQTGSAFSRPDQRRKRQTRVAGGKLYRTYIERQIVKKDQAAQACIFSNTLNKPTKLTHGYENLTPTEILRCDILPSRIMAELRATGDSTNFFTPEENQEIYKRMLIDEARKTPRQTKHLSRVTFFQKKKLCSRCNQAYYTAMPVFDETPKRDILLKTFRNLESRCVKDVELDSSPLVGKNVSINQACILSPVKQRRVVVSKIRKRNSIVRRTISNRKRIRAINTVAKRRRLHACLQSPPSMSTTMPPIVNTPAVDTNSINKKISKSIDGLHTKVPKPMFVPMKRLLRSKNFENLTRYDENQNIQDLRSSGLFNSSMSQFSSSEQITKAPSPLVTEISGVMLLSENSPLHLIKPNSTCITKDLNAPGETSRHLTNTYKQFTSGTSNSDARNNRNKLRKPKTRSWKKKWKFWQTPTNTI